MRISIGALALVALGLTACPPKPSEPPSQPGAQANGPVGTAKSFYAVYFTLPVGGIPDQEGRAKLAPFFTPALNGLLSAAAAAEERHTNSTNNEEPPLVERDPFTSLFEGATAIVGVPNCSSSGDTGTCVVNLTHKQATGAPANWTDTLNLRLVDRTWLIDDIVYGGAGPFNSSGRLTDLLNAVIAEAPPGPAPPAPTTAPPPNSNPPQTPPPPDDGNSPGGVVARFYETYKTIGHSGLPSEADRVRLAPHLTPTLNQLLKKAITADAARAPSTRFSTDPFTANPAGATSINPGWCDWGGTETPTSGICHPELTNASETWKDLPLVDDAETAGSWRVSDIEYHGTLAGDRTGKLSDLLKRLAGN